MLENAGKNHLAALDFGVSASGRLAQIPDEVNLSLINAEGSTDQSLNDQLDRLAGLQTELVLLNGDISRLEDSIACLQPIIDKLDHALKDPLSVMADITNADYTFLNPKLNKLKETHRDLTVRKDARETLDTQLTKSEMYAYEHANYQGRRIGPYKLGSYINIDELNNNNWTMMWIAQLSRRLPPALTRTAWYAPDDQGIGAEPANDAK